ncbi:MAG: glucosamine inositolphosphorylceramide transferase family protein [Solirubrobacteraceae bacterium]
MTRGSNTEVLRVAVLIESFIVPEWVRRTVARIDSSDAFELTAVIPTASVLAAMITSPERTPHTAYRVYEWLDRRVFGPASAMADADLSAISSGRATLAGVGQVDVVVSFLSADRTVWEGPPPRHGVLALAPVDDGRPASAPSRFWALRDGSSAANTAVVSLRNGHPRVVAAATAPVHPLSLTRTRDAAAWTSARLVLLCLRSLQRECGLLPGGGAPAECRDLPSPAATASHAVRTAVRAVVVECRKAWLHEEWFVATRVRTDDARARVPVRVIPNPAGRFLADPFPIEVDGRHFLFVEDYSHSDRRGAISVSEMGAHGHWSPPRKIFERDHHLSYPFVFAHEGGVYMIPETSQAGRIELHRAVEFPHRWHLERVLVDGLRAVDATLHLEDGLFWLFASVLEEHEDAGELWLFFSPSLDDEWRAHPGNPIVIDPGSTRPAGRLFRREGTLIRPSQDCARVYGEAVILNRVDVLSPREYRETPVGRIEPDWLTGVERTHTYTFDSRYECLDGYRHVRRLRVRRPRKRLA